MYYPSHLRERWARDRTLDRLLSQKANARRKGDQKRVDELEREIRELENPQRSSASF